MKYYIFFLGVTIFSLFSCHTIQHEETFHITYLSYCLCDCDEIEQAANHCISHSIYLGHKDCDNIQATNDDCLQKNGDCSPLVRCQNVTSEMGTKLETPIPMPLPDGVQLSYNSERVMLSSDNQEKVQYWKPSRPLTEDVVITFVLSDDNSQLTAGMVKTMTGNQHTLPSAKPLEVHIFEL